MLCVNFIISSYEKGATSVCNTPIPLRLYKLYDEAGNNKACYQPGIQCAQLSCQRNDKKTFAMKTTFK